MVWDSQYILGPVYTANYKLALAKSIANHWTTRAFAICLCADWTLCCCSYGPSTPTDGVQGGVMHSVLQGIWWTGLQIVGCLAVSVQLLRSPYTRLHSRGSTRVSPTCRGAPFPPPILHTQTWENMVWRRLLRDLLSCEGKKNPSTYETQN